jgi:hypothetical protein
VRGDRLETRNLLAMKAYIAAVSHTLKIVLQAVDQSRQKESLPRTIRAMAFWGTYPWRSYGYSPKPLSAFGYLTLSLSLPLRALQGMMYLAIKYIQYLSYRSFKKIDYSMMSLGVFSPSLHLREFTNRSYIGFWGETKFLHVNMAVKTVWFLVPFKPHGNSNRQLVQQIRQINQESQFKLIPLASFLSLKILGIAIRDVVSFHVFVAKLLSHEFRGQSDIRVCWIFDANNLGAGIARTELNRNLLTIAVARGNQLKNILHLMEGQSWEIALNDLAARSGLGSWGVIHTPLRTQDSQILNYLLRGDGERLVEMNNKVCCPGRSSLKTLCDLGVPRNQLQIVESQRFIHTQNSRNITYSRSSRKVLYVADTNAETTEQFAKLIAILESQLEKLDLDFFLQPHPSQSHLEFAQLPAVKHLDVGEFGVVIFGPETSSYLQPEFSESNIRVFSPLASSLSVNSIIPQVQDLIDIKISIQSLFRLDNGDDSIILRDDSFKKWRKVIDELFKP